MSFLGVPIFIDPSLPPNTLELRPTGRGRDWHADSLATLQQAIAAENAAKGEGRGKSLSGQTPPEPACRDFSAAHNHSPVFPVSDG